MTYSELGWSSVFDFVAPGDTCGSAMCRERHRVKNRVGEVQAWGGWGGVQPGRDGVGGVKWYKEASTRGQQEQVQGCQRKWAHAADPRVGRTALRTSVVCDVSPCGSFLSHTRCEGGAASLMSNRGCSLRPCLGGMIRIYLSGCVLPRRFCAISLPQ